MIKSTYINNRTYRTVYNKYSSNSEWRAFEKLQYNVYMPNIEEVADCLPIAPVLACSGNQVHALGHALQFL